MLDNTIKGIKEYPVLHIIGVIFVVAISMTVGLLVDNLILAMIIGGIIGWFIGSAVEWVIKNFGRE